MLHNTTLASYQLLPPIIVQKLQELHITTREDLVAIGSLTAFATIQAQHLGLTKSILWRLYAIEHQLSMKQISNTIKHHLNQQLKPLPKIKNFPCALVMKNYMHLAITEAKKAYSHHEVPIGAIVVYKEKIIGTGYNQCIMGHSITHHAELLAMGEASQYLKNYRLEGCDLYVTVEPCMMCTGAIIQTRMARVIYGIREAKTGAVHSCNLASYMQHPTVFKGGILSEECHKLLSQFFAAKRKSKRI